VVDEERDGRDRPPPAWMPPDAGASPDAAVGRAGRTAGSGGADQGGGAAMSWSRPLEDDVAGRTPPPDADGPPPPPWERKRRTRRRWLLLGVALLLVVAVPVGLAVAGVIGGQEDPSLAGADDDPDPGGDADGEAGQGEELPGLDVDPLDAPDLDRLDGPDAVFAQLLLDIDASELTMLSFQSEVSAAFAEHATGDVRALLQALSDAGAEGADELEAARGPLERPVGDIRAEAVREVYLAHLDSWARYMRAVEEDPALFSPDRDSSRYTLSINATADAFARSLEEQLPDDVDPEVRLMAEQLLDRGFRVSGDSDV
jgi:hypothetical protein